MLNNICSRNTYFLFISLSSKWKFTFRKCTFRKFFFCFFLGGKTFLSSQTWSSLGRGEIFQLNLKSFVSVIKNQRRKTNDVQCLPSFQLLNFNLYLIPFLIFNFIWYTFHYYLLIILNIKLHFSLIGKFFFGEFYVFE